MVEVRAPMKHRCGMDRGRQHSCRVDSSPLVMLVGVELNEMRCARRPERQWPAKSRVIAKTGRHIGAAKVAYRGGHRQRRTEQFIAHIQPKLKGIDLLRGGVGLEPK